VHIKERRGIATDTFKKLFLEIVGDAYFHDKITTEQFDAIIVIYNFMTPEGVVDLGNAKVKLELID